MAKSIDARVNILADTADLERGMRRSIAATDKFNKSTKRVRQSPFRGVTRSVAGLAGAAGRAVPEAARGAAGAVTGAVGLGQAATRQPGALTSPIYPEGSVPDISGYQYPGMISQQNPLGPWQANLAYQKQLQDVENQNIMKLGNYQLLNADEVKRRDFQRNAAAAQLATNLATQSQLQLGAQRNAAAMAGQALADVGATSRTQYSYL